MGLSSHLGTFQTWVTRAAGILAALIGALGLYGWFTGSRILTAVGQGYIPIAPNTAAAFVLMGLALAAVAGNSPKLRTVGGGIALVTLVVVGGRFLEYALGVDLAVDHWFFQFPAENLGLAPVGKMALYSALNFLFVGLAILILADAGRGRGINDLARVLAAVAAFIGLAFALGYLYASPLLYGSGSIPMALPTAVGFVVLGAGAALQASLREIAERRREREALVVAHAELQEHAREREELFRTFMNHTPAMAFMKDEEGRYVYMNQPMERTFGVRLDDLRGKTDDDWLPPEAARQVRENDAGVLAHGNPTELLESAPTPDGRMHHWLSLRFPFQSTSGQRFLGGVSLDVTDRLAAQEEVRRMNVELEARIALRTAQLEAANAELESFSYSVSHDLRAPLRSIKGFTQMLMEDHGERFDEAARQHMSRVCAATDRMSRLIDDLLALARVSRSELRRERVDLGAVARGVVEELRERDPARAVQVVVEEGLIVDADPRLLEVVLENLIGNAWKFTARKPAATIEVGSAPCNGDGPPGRAYYVRDDGAGFDMTYAGKLFSPFQRLHGIHEFDGAGVGLATVKRVIGRHGGRVWAEAEPDRGATFYFTL